MRALAAILALLIARTAEAGDCAPRDAEAADVRVDRDGVTVCYDQCWRLDAASRRWSITPAPPPEVEPPAPKISVATKVCAPDCVVLPGVAEISARDVVERPDRSMIAVRGPGHGKDEPLYVFDAAGALLTTIHAWKTAMGDPAPIQRVAFVDDALYVAVSSSPVSSAGRLFDPRTGKRIAEVGGKGAELDEQTVVELGGHRWAFAAFDSNELYVHDVVTGKRSASIRWGAKDGGYRAVRVAGNRLVAVHGTARGGVMLYDLGQRKASSAVVPLCK